jgi:hypothetical protein
LRKSFFICPSFLAITAIAESIPSSRLDALSFGFSFLPFRRIENRIEPKVRPVEPQGRLIQRYLHRPGFNARGLPASRQLLRLVKSRSENTFDLGVPKKFGYRLNN